MGSNIEIKARARDFHRQQKLAAQLATGDPQHLYQEDTFFKAPTGRLKLRDFGTGSGELIQYQRENSPAPTESRYVLSPTSEPATLKTALANALGVRAVVTKKRTVYLVGRTRIHLDQVENLGEFIELEVVLTPGEQPETGHRIACELMKELEIEDTDLVESAYVDLLG